MNRTTRWFSNYFYQPARVSRTRRSIAIVLGVILFILLAVFGPILAAQLTVYNPDFIATTGVNSIDVTAAANTWIDQNVTPGKPIIAKGLKIGVARFEPQIRDGIYQLINGTYTRLLNRLENGKLLDEIVSQRSNVIDVVNNIQSFLDLPFLDQVADALNITPGSVQQYLNTDQINKIFDDLEKVATVQTQVTLIDNIYIPLIIVTLVLIIAIIFVARKFSFIGMLIGVVFTTYGVLQLAGVFPINSYLQSLVTQPGLPAGINNWMVSIIDGVFRILAIYSGVLLFCGIVLIVLHYLFKPHPVIVQTPAPSPK